MRCVAFKRSTWAFFFFFFYGSCVLLAESCQRITSHVKWILLPTQSVSQEYGRNSTFALVGQAVQKRQRMNCWRNAEITLRERNVWSCVFTMVWQGLTWPRSSQTKTLSGAALKTFKCCSWRVQSVNQSCDLSLPRYYQQQNHSAFTCLPVLQFEWN